MEVSICGEQRGIGLTWPRWRRLVAAAEALGFAGLYVADHFPVHHGTIETFAALGYLADRTERVRFGPLVSPLSFRHPTHLAWQAASLDDLSGGRMVLGLGTGWLDHDHDAFGHELGDAATRSARLAEGLEVVTRLLRGEGPTSYEGRFYRLRDAQLLPRPARRGGPPVLVGGNGRRRTLPLAARYADAWNGAHLTPDAFRASAASLDALARSAGRPPPRRTLLAIAVCGRDEAERDRRVRWLRDWMPDVANQSYGTILETASARLTPLLEGMGASFCPLIGTPEDVAARMREYAAAGVEELILSWYDTEDVEGLELLARHVLPRIAD
jgi:alkanesulfonate monooxygenase SsuD/methylene tetrahydromethanopterin reductase-like flavin-dependent oxidoreductase (luciferase family)